MARRAATQARMWTAGACKKAASLQGTEQSRGEKGPAVSKEEASKKEHPPCPCGGVGQLSPAALCLPACLRGTASNSAVSGLTSRRLPRPAPHVQYM